MTDIAMASKEGIWTAMDAFLSDYPYDDNPQNIVIAMTKSDAETLPYEIVAHPEFRSVPLSLLANRIKHHALQLDIFKTDEQHQ